MSETPEQQLRRPLVIKTFVYKNVIKRYHQEQHKIGRKTSNSRLFDKREVKEGGARTHWMDTGKRERS